MMINGRRYTVEHGEEAINFNMTRDVCGLCRCNNGRFEFCSRVRCPYVRDNGTRPCNNNGTMIPHRGTYEDDCNTCRCLNGNVRCTDRDCSDDEDDMDDDDDFARCRRMPRSPVCTSNMRTHPNPCTALAAGFERFEISPGACSRDVSNAIISLNQTYLYIIISHNFIVLMLCSYVLIGFNNSNSFYVAM